MEAVPPQARDIAGRAGKVAAEAAGLPFRILRRILPLPLPPLSAAAAGGRQEQPARAAPVEPVETKELVPGMGFALPPSGLRLIEGSTKPAEEVNIYVGACNWKPRNPLFRLIITTFPPL